MPKFEPGFWTDGSAGLKVLILIRMFFEGSFLKDVEEGGGSI